jgi:hypothetical protein
MGWTSIPGYTKSQIIREVTRTGPNSELVETSVKGNCVWMVSRIYHPDGTLKSQGIILYLLEKLDGDWGYKGIDETSHPYYYSVPKSWLKRYPLIGDFCDRSKESSAEWRAKVRSHAADQAAERSVRASLTAGDRFMLRNVGPKYDGSVATVVNPRPLRVTLTGHRGYFGVRSSQIGERVG